MTNPTQSDVQLPELQHLPAARAAARWKFLPSASERLADPRSAAPGDTVTFISTDRGHNAENIEGMLPEGVEAFASPMGEDYVLTVTEVGLYGIKCTPHFTMGMVALIQVGEAVNLDAVSEVTLRGKASSRFEPLLAQVAM